MDILQRKRQVGAGAAPGATAAGGVAPSPAAAPAAPAAAPAPQQRGSGFVSFDRYLDANRAGAQAMAQRAGDAVEKKATAAAGALQGAQDTFAQKSRAAALAYDPTKAKTSAEAQKLAGTAYTGPKGWADAGVDTAKLAETVNAGQAAVAQLQSAGGIASLLRESYNSGPMTAGGLGLDAALAGAAGGDRFSQLNAAYGDLGNRLVSGQKAAGTAYDANLAATKDAATKYGELAGTLAQQEQAARMEEARQRATRVGEAQRARDYADNTWTEQDAARQDDLKNRKRRRLEGGD